MYFFLFAGVVFFIFTLLLLGRVYWRIEEKKRKWKIFKVLPNRLSEKNPHIAEQMFAVLHGIQEEIGFWGSIFGKSPFRFSVEIGNTDGRVHFVIRTPEEKAEVIESQVYAHYPDADIQDITEHPPSLSGAGRYSELTLTGASIWPIKRYSQFEDRIAKVLNDPISSITLPFSRGKEKCVLQYIIEPVVSSSFRMRAIKCLRIVHSGVYKNLWLKEVFEKAFMTEWFWSRVLSFPKLFFFWMMRGGSTGTDIPENSADNEMEMSQTHDREGDLVASSNKLSRLPFKVTLRILVFSSSPSADQKIKEIAGSFQQFTLPHLNGFALTKIRSFSPKKLQSFLQCFPGQQNILSTEELATLIHLPNKTVATPNIEWVESKKMEPPQGLPLEREEDITLLGTTNFRGTLQNFGIRPDDRRRHIYMVGKTGMGKSTLLENMIFSDIQSGKGVAIIDPHGDLAEAVIDFVPKSRTNDVILFDPSDSEYPVSFNMLECKIPEQRHLIASGVLGVFKKMFSESWGPRLEHILRNTLLALIEAEGQTLLGVMRMLVDGKYRHKILKSVKDPMVKSFWENEFGRWEPKQMAEAVSPIQNKVGQFLSSSMIRNILGQPKSSIDLRFAMDKGKIIIINLSKGRIGEDNSSLLGSMLVTKFQLDIMSRADTLEKDRKDFYLYVDEFQNFATTSFATILSEARKYRLSLTVANQYLAQMEEEVADAIFGNVGTLISFQVGFDDAESIANQFGGEEVILPADIGNLPKYHAYLRLMMNGMPSRVFSARTLPPPMPEEDEGRRERIVKVCRERYAAKREEVEEKIEKWGSSMSNEQLKINDPVGAQNFAPNQKKDSVGADLVSAQHPVGARFIAPNDSKNVGGEKNLLPKKEEQKITPPDIPLKEKKSEYDEVTTHRLETWKTVKAFFGGK